MGKFYTANKELNDYLTELGLTFHDRGEVEVSYFTEHSSGKQVKVNHESNLVTFMDNAGIELDSSSCFTDNQIEKFLDN
jgi:hypothetical protein